MTRQMQNLLFTKTGEMTQSAVALRQPNTLVVEAKGQANTSTTSASIGGTCPCFPVAVATGLDF